MVVKPVVLNWHREEFKLGKKENIPSEALQILESEAANKKENKKEKKPTEIEEAQ